MKPFPILLLAFCIIFIVVSCKKTSSKKEFTPTCTGTKSFALDVNLVIYDNCRSCHINYDNYATIKASADLIRNSIAFGTMPKNGTLTDKQKNDIICWIDQGAPWN
ncbi:MAG: hypothetical protein ACK504_07015 [Bacteroidota bacterium]